jgi:hemerythrin-like domain-containing protein
MVTRLDVGRRWLVGAGAISGLVMGIPALPVLADEQTAMKKPENQAPVTVTEDLMREHGLLERILLIYEAGVRRLGQGEDMDPAMFTAASTLMRDFVHDYHEKGEEEEIFPRFKKAGRMINLVDTLVVQHGAGRKLTDRILQIAPTTRDSKDQRKIMTDAMQATIVMYRPHMAREDVDVFPTLRSLTTPTEFEGLGETMEKREKAKFAGDGFEKCAKDIETIEKRIGIDDLNQVTPKI